jgi:hypothetical protein
MSATAVKGGVGVYTWTPKQGVGGGKSWIEADFTVTGVRKDVAEKYRKAGTCREVGPKGNNLVRCRGGKGVNKGQPACGNVED